MDAEAPDDGLLVINDPFYQERQARVNEQPAEALRVDLGFTAIPVPSRWVASWSWCHAR